MTIANPEELIESLRAFPSETEWFEFKVGHYKPEDLGEYISALANSAMLHDKRIAYIVFGITDGTHELVGTDIRLQNETVKGEILEHWLSRYLNPRINVRFESFRIDGKHIELVCIEPAYDRPVKFNNVAYIRINSVKKRLDNFPEKERTLWNLTSRYSFEEGLAASHYSDDELYENFHCDEFSEMVYGKVLQRELFVDNLILDGLIIDNLQGGYDITNLFAICATKNLHKYKTISHKAPRVISYKTATKLTGVDDVTGTRGYIVAFQRILKYILKETGAKEVMEHGVRKKIYNYPERAMREFLANTLIHQDLTDLGSPTIEIFADKVQFTNPGSPLISVDRFIDAPARSRNEKLAGLMRKANLCEDRGSGIDRALWAIEENNLAPPTFAEVEGATVVTVFRNTNFAAMSKEDRIRACYQHSCLMYLKSAPMSNSTLRGRLGLNKNQYPQVSNVISDAIGAGMIRPLDADQGNRQARYVPYWA